MCKTFVTRCFMRKYSVKMGFCRHLEITQKPPGVTRLDFLEPVCKCIINCASSLLFLLSKITQGRRCHISAASAQQRGPELTVPGASAPPERAQGSAASPTQQSSWDPVQLGSNLFAGTEVGLRGAQYAPAPVTFIFCQLEEERHREATSSQGKERAFGTWPEA